MDILSAATEPDQVLSPLYRATLQPIPAKDVPSDMKDRDSPRLLFKNTAEQFQTNDVQLTNPTNLTRTRKPDGTRGVGVRIGWPKDKEMHADIRNSKRKSQKKTKDQEPFEELPKSHTKKKRKRLTNEVVGTESSEEQENASANHLSMQPTIQGMLENTVERYQQPDQDQKNTDGVSGIEVDQDQQKNTDNPDVENSYSPGSFEEGTEITSKITSNEGCTDVEEIILNSKGIKSAATYQGLEVQEESQQLQPTKSCNEVSNKQEVIAIKTADLSQEDASIIKRLRPRFELIHSRNNMDVTDVITAIITSFRQYKPETRLRGGKYRLQSPSSIRTALKDWKEEQGISTDIDLPEATQFVQWLTRGQMQLGVARPKHERKYKPFAIGYNSSIPTLWIVSINTNKGESKYVGYDREMAISELQ